MFPVSAHKGETAFFAVRSAYFSNTDDQDNTIPFDHIIVDEGNSFDPLSGIFFAPENGTYQFYYSMRTYNAGILSTRVNLYHNLNVVATAERFKRDSDEMMSNSAIVQLVTNDRVFTTLANELNQ